MRRRRSKVDLKDSRKLTDNQGSGRSCVVAIEDGHALSLLLARRHDEAGDSCNHLFFAEPTKTASTNSTIQRLSAGNPSSWLTPLELNVREDIGKAFATLPVSALEHVVRPISAKDLLARIRSFLKLAMPETSVEPLTAGSIELCRENWRVRRSGREVRLGRKEFRLLELLMEKPGCVLAREQLRSHVWGDSTEIDERSVDVLIRRLRNALSLDGENDPILTVRGSGYSFDATSAGPTP